MYSPVKFLIFDLDGTLLDTENLFFEAYEILLKRYGKIFTNDMKLHCVGKNKIQLHTYLINELDIKNTTINELAAEGAAIQDELYEERGINIMPGAEKLVTHMANHNIEMGIATSSPKWHFCSVAKYHKKFFRYFNYIITGENKRSKPYPDLFIACAKRFQENFNPADFLVFEDTPLGVEAAKNAGMQVIMIPLPIIPPEQFQNATKVIKSMNDFIPEEFNLPPYEKSV